MVEVLFRRYTAQGMTPEEAFNQSCESITGPITRIISRDGMLGVYNSFSDAGGWVGGWEGGCGSCSLAPRHLPT